jgi:hypothetical protein
MFATSTQPNNFFYICKSFNWEQSGMNTTGRPRNYILRRPAN